MTVQVNDVLFREHQFHGLHKVSVSTITHNGKSIHVSDGALLDVHLGTRTFDGWNSVVYHAWTQALEDDYQFQKLGRTVRKRLAQLNSYGLSTEEFKRIADNISAK